MADQRMVDYIRGLEAKGYRAEQIRAGLLNQGYSPVEIDQAIAIAHAARMSPQFGSQLNANQAPKDLSRQYNNLQKKAGNKIAPFGIKLISILFFLGGILLLGLGVLSIAVEGIVSAMLNQVPELAALGAGFFMLIGGFFMAFGIVYLLLGYGLWKCKKWARIIVMIIIGLGAIGSLILIVLSSYLMGGFMLLVYAFILWYLIGGKGVKEAFA